VLVAAVSAVAVFAVLTAVLGGVLLFRVLNELGDTGPEEDDPEVVAAREVAARELSADTDRLAVAVVAPALGPGSAHLGRGQVEPPCHVGQHNWKIDDDFDLACGLQRIEVVSAPRRASFATDMEALDSALRAEGWVPSPVREMDDVVLDWDRHGAPSALPGTGYTRTVQGESRSLELRWAASGSPADAISLWADDAERLELRTAAGDQADPSSLLEEIPAGGYAVVLTEGVEYFRQ
jgi:hypothetical protein